MTLAFQRVSDRVHAETGIVGTGTAAAIRLDDQTVVIDAHLVHSWRDEINGTNFLVKVFLTPSACNHAPSNLKV